MYLLAVDFYFDDLKKKKIVNCIIFQRSKIPVKFLKNFTSNFCKYFLLVQH